MRNPDRISFPSAAATWTIRSCGIAGEVNLWSHAWGIYEAKAVTLHASGNWQPNTHLSTLEIGLAENVPELNIQSPKLGSLWDTPHPLLPLIARARVPSPPRGKLQDHPHEALLKEVHIAEERHSFPS